MLTFVQAIDAPKVRQGNLMACRTRDDGYIDVHVSKMDPQTGDTKRLEDVLEQIQVVESPGAGGTRPFTDLSHPDSPEAPMFEPVPSAPSLHLPDLAPFAHVPRCSKRT